MPKVTLTPVHLGPKRSAGMTTPAFSMELADDERIVTVEHRRLLGGGERKTDDHYLTVWVERPSKAGGSGG
jgi:hypothetical protein